MAFVLDVNLRIQEILGLQKVEAALAKTQGGVQAGAAAGGGGAGGVSAASKAQTAAAIASAAAINKVTVANHKLTASQNKAIGATQKAASGMKSAAGRADTFGKSIQIAGKRYAAFLAATVVPFAALAGLSKATASVIEFDGAMLKMRQITGQTEEQMGGMRDSILDMATATGTSASEIARIGKIMSQAGFRGDQLTESLTALSKVPLTPSFETIDAAVEGTIAALNQFNSEGLTTTEILDIMTAVSNKFAASSEDIAKGIARGGAAFEAIGGTFREFVGIFTTVRQATRESAETVGTFMKTISSRLADPKIVNFLEGKGIRIGEAIEAGDPVGALKQIGIALEGITSIQERTAISIKLGGRRQISRLQALVSNLDTLDDALQIAGTSAGAFGEIAEVGLQGLQAQLNILGQEFNKLVQTLAEPMFIPIIRGVTTVGKAFVAFLDFVKPIIPALTTVIGFAAGFKLLAISIGAAAKALAFMSTVGVGGGIPGLLGAVTGGAGGAAGASARERVQRRLAGGVGGAAVAGGAGAGLAGGAQALATSKLGQLAGAAGLILVADKLSASFEKAGESSLAMTADFVTASAAILVAVSLLSGKSIVEGVKGIVGALGPWGSALAIGTAALAAFAFAAKKAVDADVQDILDAAAKKISEIPIEPLKLGEPGSLEQAVGDLGLTAVEDGIQEAAERYQEGFSGFVAGAIDSFANLIKGEGLVPISDAQAQEIIETMIGNNPELLNEILRSAVERFGTEGLEAGFEQILIERGASAELAAILRQAMIKQFGSLTEIAGQFDELAKSTAIQQLVDQTQKAADDFAKIHVPVRLTHEFTSLSGAIGDAVRSIQLNIGLFDKLSQAIGGGVNLPKPEFEWTQESVRDVLRQGRIGDLIAGLDDFPELEGAAADITQVAHASDLFLQSFLKSADAAARVERILDPTIDPMEVTDEFIEQFIKANPSEVPPHLRDLFIASARNISTEITSALGGAGEKIFNVDMANEIVQTISGQQGVFVEAFVGKLTEWLNESVKLTAKQMRAAELKPEIFAGAQRPETILGKLAENIGQLDDIPLPRGLQLITQGIGTMDDALVDTAQSQGLVNSLMISYETEARKLAEMLRMAEEQATQTGTAIDGDMNAKLKDQHAAVLLLKGSIGLLNSVVDQSSGSFDRYIQKLVDAEYPKEVLDQQKRDFEEIIAKQKETLTMGLKLIDADIAIDVSNVLKTPTDHLVEALERSQKAVVAWTGALSIKDLEKGLSTLQPGITPGGRPFAERVKPSREFFDTQQERQAELGRLRTGAFGATPEIVMGEFVDNVREFLDRKLRFTQPGSTPEFGQQLAAFDAMTNSIYSVPEAIKSMNLSMKELDELTTATARSLKKMSEQPGAREGDFLGIVERGVADIANALKEVVMKPEIFQQPRAFAEEELSPAFLNALKNLSQQQPLVQPAGDQQRVWDQLQSSATEIGQAANEDRMAAEATGRATEEIQIASTNIQTGGQDILIASQGMTELVQQMQAIVDIPREALTGPQQTAVGNVEGESAREAIAQTTEAVNALGQRMDAVTQAVEFQTQQGAELSAIEQEKPLVVEGLKDNTDIIAANNEVAGKTQESMAGLDDGMTKVAGAMEEGIGIDIETMSKVKIDVQGVAEAAKEFTAEFEAVAIKVAKTEIRAVLQQLARAAGSSEAAATFESVV